MSGFDLLLDEIEKLEAKLAEAEKAATLSAQGGEIAKLNHVLDDMANENIALEATAKAAEAKLAEYRNALEIEHSCNWCLHSDDCTIRCENTVVCQEFERQTKGR